MISSSKIIYAYLTIILLLVVLPINGKNSKINHNFILNLRLDYLFHSLMFFPWMGFLLLNDRLIKPVLWLFIGLFLAILVEAIQLLLPYRTFNINDLLANCCGVFIGLVFMFLPHRKLQA